MRRVLALDGGGIRGIISAVVLGEMERLSGLPIQQQFDLIAGTSTGGILAVGLGTGLSPLAMADLYQNEGAEIFSRTGLGHILRSGANITRYSNMPRLRVLERHFGKITMGNLEPHVMACAFDVFEWRPKVFKSWTADDHSMAAVTAAMATSSAPVYFPPYLGWVDGGVYANDPSLAALAEAMRLWPGEQIELLSVGCGGGSKVDYGLDHPCVVDDRSFGLLKIGAKLTDLFIDSACEASEYMAQQILGERYRRLQPRLGNVSPAMDDASDGHIVVLRLFAESWIVGHCDEIQAAIRRPLEKAA